jgi:putative Mg2+ transporter-C (MgtC) family protein
MSELGLISLNWDWAETGRLALAMLMGAAIGFEREYRKKPAGLKTISLVTLSTAMLMLLSIKLGTMAGNGINLDLSRIAAGVVTGIGFLGAGTIIQNRDHVEGITTATTIWLMAGVGMCIGAGLYGLGLTAYFLGWLGLSLDPLGNRMLKELDRKPREKTEAYKKNKSASDS